MDGKPKHETAPRKNITKVERRSERELVVTRTFDAPARIVFDAWTRPELLERWWAPRSMTMTLVSVEADVRVGGSYRLEFAVPEAPEPVAFFGRYIEVTPPSRLVWTNDEGGPDGAVTTVTLEEQDGRTLLVLSELYPSSAALDAALEAGNGLPEQFEQLDELLLTLGAASGGA